MVNSNFGCFSRYWSCTWRWCWYWCWRPRYNSAFWVTIIPPDIWISCITPMPIVAIWSWAKVVPVVNWSVFWNMRPILIPSLTGKTVLSSATRWKFGWFWNIQTIRMTIFYDMAWFRREAIWWTIIFQFAKVVFSVKPIWIVIWAFPRVVSV